MNIKAKDLMIGNWVHNPIQDKSIQVDGSLIALEQAREKMNPKHKGFLCFQLLSELWLTPDNSHNSFIVTPEFFACSFNCV